MIDHLTELLEIAVAGFFVVAVGLSFAALFVLFVNYLVLALGLCL